jgi:hypothetical protein
VLSESLAVKSAILLFLGLSSCFSMPPPSLLPFLMSSTPPTSPQRSQAAGHQAERANRIIGSLEQRRTPAGPSVPSTAAAAPSLPPRGPVTFQGQTYQHLPPDLVARLAQLPPLPVAPSCRRPSSIVSTSVSLHLFIKYKKI